MYMLAGGVEAGVAVVVLLLDTPTRLVFFGSSAVHFCWGVVKTFETEIRWSAYVFRTRLGIQTYSVGAPTNTSELR